MREIKKVIFTLVLYLFAYSVFSQSSPVAYVDSIKAQKISYDEIASQIEHYFLSLPKDTAHLEDAYYEYSKWCYQYYRNYEKAQLYAKKERVIRVKKYTKTANHTTRNLYNLGLFHSRSTSPDLWSAKAYFDTLVSVSKGNDLRIAKTYQVLGNIYKQWGDFQNAFEHYLLSEQIFRDQEYYKGVVDNLNNMLASYVELNDPIYLPDFIKIKEKIDALPKDTISEKSEADIIYNTAVMYHIANVKEAEESALHAFSLRKSLNDPDETFKSISLLGIIATKKGDFEMARNYFNESSSYAVNNKILLSNISNNLGSLELKSENYEKALDHFYDAISLVNNGAPASPKRQLPSQEEISISPDKKRLFTYLYDVSNGWMEYYQKHPKEEYLLQALDILAYTDRTIDELFLESQEELSKLNWRKKASDIYMSAIKVAHLLKRNDIAFYYMEKKKGLLLLENTTETLAKQRANIPKQILDIEESMLSNIRSHLNSIENTSATETQSKETKVLQTELFSIKRRYRKFIDSIEVLYPVYVNSKRQFNISSLKEIQNALSTNEHIVSYALGDSLGYVMNITKNEIQLKEIPVSIPILQQQIEEFQQVLTRPLTTLQETTDYKKIATHLSSNLLPFIRFRESVPATSLIIIPDGSIQKVPFEALMLSEEAIIADAYLINNYTISYKYSHSLDEHITQLQPSKNQSTSFLPTHFKDDYLASLPNSTKEADEIIEYYQDHIYTEKKANKSSFLNQFDHHSIIHISTHGGTDLNGPWLAFYDDKLRLEELYSTTKRKELVVLSACKTDVGDIKKGEGVFSIKRGFFKAGARSVISTLWDVNEKANMEITTSFYKEITAGKKKSEALRNAKLSYLKKHANTSEASPYYWSGITLTGHDNTLDLSITSMSPTVWVLIVICVLILLFLLTKKALRK
ncbi:hypothetical protein GCM10011344_34100 [Dokdonia pacifica]|uniref:CHAT domain-containing protein n=1 Tax=Dokdonia pacifica TaxID=1627892 RepID=A0A239BDD0_9FLAO|nr:CHAT domain-containing tetratricopeptide repeat protein [Dokdonia pacifica]GGG30351.1 hypothetical protein GCM10011344_34100 [Dokdonia pacifica]SNS05053.1 CHAT domain-containing protein [Dokdonia pacifica]